MLCAGHYNLLKSKPERENIGVGRITNDIPLGSLCKHTTITPSQNPILIIQAPIFDLKSSDVGGGRAVHEMKGMMPRPESMFWEFGLRAARGFKCFRVVSLCFLRRRWCRRFES